MIVTLVRDISRPDCTEGSLTAGSFTCYTIEQPWDNNIPNRSCVPTGAYLLVPYFSPKHNMWTWCMDNHNLGIYVTPDMIPTGIIGRCVCEIHAANQAWQLEGCIAVGSGRVLMDIGEGMLPSVSNSDNTFQDLRSVLAPLGDYKYATGHTLVITTGQ